MDWWHQRTSGLCCALATTIFHRMLSHQFSQFSVLFEAIRDHYASKHRSGLDRNNLCPLVIAILVIFSHTDCIRLIDEIQNVRNGETLTVLYPHPLPHYRNLPPTVSLPYLLMLLPLLLSHLLHLFVRHKSHRRLLAVPRDRTETVVPVHENR